MLISFNMKFIRRNQIQRRSDEACRGSLICFCSSLVYLNLITKDTKHVFFLFFIPY